MGGYTQVPSHSVLPGPPVRAVPSTDPRVHGFKSIKWPLLCSLHTSELLSPGHTLTEVNLWPVNPVSVYLCMYVFLPSCICVSNIILSTSRPGEWSSAERYRISLNHGSALQLWCATTPENLQGWASHHFLKLPRRFPCAKVFNFSYKLF